MINSLRDFNYTGFLRFWNYVGWIVIFALCWRGITVVYPSIKENNVFFTFPDIVILIVFWVTIAVTYYFLSSIILIFISDRENLFFRTFREWIVTVFSPGIFMLMGIEVYTHKESLYACILVSIVYIAVRVLRSIVSSQDIGV